MRNTSETIKENNSHVMNAQGGEKKVMKKILSVALSTAMAFSMFASVAFGDTAVTPQQQFDALKAKGIFNGYPDGTAGLDKDMTRAEFAKVITKLLGLKEITGVYSYTDKNYNAKNWAAPYIEAVTAAGIMEGKNVEKKIFDFNGKVTVSEMATILTRALDLEIPAETNNNAAAWAKGYVQAAINAGLIDANANFGANASRELLVGAAYAIDQAQNLKVTKYEVSEAGKVVTFTISDGETVKVTLDKALEANKETEVKFTYKDKQFTEKVTYVVEAATKVQSASSVNLKEVDVAFDGKVDKATATDKNNYTVDSNSKGIKSITLLEDGKTARLLLNESSKFTQGTTYKVVVKNVKSSTGTVLPQGEVSFTSADNTLPTVTEVKALGTKVIKVTFSEPVVAPTSSNFQLDDKAYVGSVTLGANQREVILRDYTGTISEGAHKLTTSLVEDFAGLKSLAATTDFTVAVDTEGPKVTEISATLEKVTVTFDEEIDPNSVTNDSFYWKSGDSKKTGTVTQVASNVYEVQFTSANRLPGYESTLFVEVKDYSGNANAVKEHKINASVDLVRPQVVEVAYGSRVANKLTVRFDKTVDIKSTDREFFTIKKGDDTIPVRSIENVDGKIFNLEFYSNLEYGTYSIKVAGVKDTTALANTVVEYNGTFIASDYNAPVLKGEVDAKNNSRKVTLNFDRDMDLARLNNANNYYIKFTKDGSNVTEQRALPADVRVNAVNGGKSVTLLFPEFIDGTRVTFGSTGSVSSITVAGLQSRTGQNVAIQDFATVVNPLAVKTVTQKDSKTFEVEFNKVVASAATSDFRVGNATPSSVTIDGTKVTLKTTSEFPTGTSVTVLANRAQSYSENVLETEYSTNTNNAVAPKIAVNNSVTLSQVDQTVEIPFTVDLASNYKGQDLASELANDLIVTRIGENAAKPLTAKVDYSTEIVDGDTIRVTFLNTNYNDEYSIKIKKDASYIRAAGDAEKVAAESDTYTTSANNWKNTTPVDISTATYTATTPGAVATATLSGLTISAKEQGTAANDTKIKIVERDSQTNAVVLNDSTIYVKDVDTVTHKDVIDYLKDAGFAYDVTTTDETAFVQAGEFTLANGVDPVGNVVVVFDKDVAKVENVTVDGKAYAADVAKLGTDKRTLTINVNKEAVVGKTVSVKATDVKGQSATVTEVVAN
ncbi:S-layer homology domain-containing protein [Paenibacillus illinoisensis]|uniref:S-layer homology domain-containing protein n=1 Tax=Paenibacillus illinoisensis TaxID=59845 RepID=UPI003A4DE42B